MHQPGQELPRQPRLQRRPACSGSLEFAFTASHTADKRRNASLIEFARITCGLKGTTFRRHATCVSSADLLCCITLCTVVPPSQSATIARAPVIPASTHRRVDERPFTSSVLDISVDQLVQHYQCVGPCPLKSVAVIQQRDHRAAACRGPRCAPGAAARWPSPTGCTASRP